MGYQGTKSLLIHKRPKDARPTESGPEAGAGTESEVEPETPALVFRKLEGDELFSFLKIQLEYYFSKQNLEKDAYLNSQMDETKFVPVELIASFPKVKRLTEDRALIMKAMKECKNIQINEDETKNTPSEEILKIFEGDAECSKPISVKSDIGDTWFVTFETEQDCMDTAMHVNLSGKQLRGKNISCRVKSTTSARFFTPSNKQAQPIIPPAWPTPGGPGFPGFDGEAPGTGGKKPRAKKGKKKKNVSPPVSDDDTTKEQKRKQTAKQKWQKKPVAASPSGKEMEAPPTPKEDMKKTPNKQKWVKKTDAPAGTLSSPLSYEEMTASAAAAALTKEEKQASEEQEAQHEQRKSERSARAAAAKKEKKKKDKSKIKRDRKLTLGEIPNEVPPSGGYTIPFKKYDREMMATAVQALMDNEDLKRDIFGKVADKTVMAKKPLDACQLLDPMPVFYPSKPSKFHAAMPVRSSKALGYR